MTLGRVVGLAITPVKGTRLIGVQAVRVDEQGVRENRRFFLIDDRARMVNAKQIGELQTIVSRYSDEHRQLELVFPDGRTLTGPLELAAPLEVSFFSRQALARPVLGDWSQAISAHVGRSVRLVEASEEGGVDRGATGAVTLISRASLARLAQEGALGELDSRRFRMLIEIDGVDAHAEDAWIGRSLTVGEATIRPRGHVGRCLITRRDPETGTIDVPTLDLLSAYRGELDTTEPLPFGIYAEVVQPGAVRVGDAVVLAAG